MKFLAISVVLLASGCAVAQDIEPLSAGEKLLIHTERTFGPLQLAGTALGAGLEQIENNPKEWQQGVVGYARRYAGIEGYVAVSNAMAFGFDAIMHDDPRYFRARQKRFLPRLAHALSYSFITPTDDGGHRFNTWRMASNYGGAWFVNLWAPHRVSTTGDVLVRGSLGMALDTGSNLGAEFLPDLKALVKKVIRRK